MIAVICAIVKLYLKPACIQCHFTFACKIRCWCSWKIYNCSTILNTPAHKSVAASCSDWQFIFFIICTNHIIKLFAGTCIKMYSIFICCPYWIQSDSFAITWLKSAYNLTRLILLLAACFNRPAWKCITRSYKLIILYSCLSCIHKWHFFHRTCCSITIRYKLYSIAVFLPVSCICPVSCRTCCYNYFFTCAIYACSTPACKRITFTHWCLKCNNTAVNLISTWVICFSTIQIIHYLIYIFTKSTYIRYYINISSSLIFSSIVYIF